jgi:predicted F0F1-ATPase subunit
VNANDKPVKTEDPDEQIRLLSPGAVRFWRQVARMTSIGWSTVLPIAGGVLLGHFLDQRTGSKYVWTIGLLVAGIMVAFYNLYHMMTQEMDE